MSGRKGKCEESKCKRSIYIQYIYVYVCCSIMFLSITRNFRLLPTKYKIVYCKSLIGLVRLKEKKKN